MDCTPPGSSVPGLLQARTLEWVAISFSRGSSPPRDRTRVSHTAGGFYTIWPTREAFTFCLNSCYGKGSSRVASKQTGKNVCNLYIYIFIYIYKFIFLYILNIIIPKWRYWSPWWVFQKMFWPLNADLLWSVPQAFCCHRCRCLGMTDVRTCTLEQIQILQWLTRFLKGFLQ